MRVWESYPNAWISVQLPKDVQIRVWGYPPKISADPYGSALFQVKGSLVVHLVEAVAGLEQKPAHVARVRPAEGGGHRSRMTASKMSGNNTDVPYTPHCTRFPGLRS